MDAGWGLLVGMNLVIIHGCWLGITIVVRTHSELGYHTWMLAGDYYRNELGYHTWMLAGDYYMNELGYHTWMLAGDYYSSQNSL